MTPATRSEVVDPVCGEVFRPELATFKSQWEGRKVFFCSSTCKEEFDSDPDGYPLPDQFEEET